MIAKDLGNGIRLLPLAAEYAQRTEALQRIVFPDLSDEERMKAAHYLRHLEVFPEGQFIVVNAADDVIGMTTTMRYHYSLDDHTFLDISDGMMIGTHEPDGEWLYGLDVGVHPDYRGQGIAKELYKIRHALVQELGLKGQLTVGMINGYHQYKDTYTTDAYFALVKDGTLTDPTVSAQQKMGFRIIKLINDYLDDPTCGNAGVLMEMPASHQIR